MFECPPLAASAKVHGSMKKADSKIPVFDLNFAGAQRPGVFCRTDGPGNEHGCLPGFTTELDS